MLKTFDVNKPFDLHLDPPSSENPTVCRIAQDGKDPIITTDFYLTNVAPRKWILPTPLTNNKVATYTMCCFIGTLFYTLIIVQDKRRQHQTLPRVETIMQINRIC